MDIKKILKQNKITQQELADRCGISRQAMNTKLNSSQPPICFIDVLTVMILERRGVKLDTNYLAESSNDK